MTSKPTHHTLDQVPAPRFSPVLSTLVALAAVAAMVLPASAYSADTTSKSAHKATPQQTQKKGSLKIKHQRSPSEESTAQRDRRLHRECKGMPNAGACLGYTRK